MYLGVLLWSASYESCPTRLPSAHCWCIHVRLVRWLWLLIRPSTALRRTTLSDPRWDIRGATAHGMKHLRDKNPPKTHKKRRTEALEVPSDLQDMEVPLEDMGDVIVLTGL